MLVIYGQYPYLLRRNPKRELACEMLDDDSYKSLYTSESNPVNYDWPVLFTVFTYIRQIKSLRQLEVKLYCSTLPSPSQAVLQMEVYLGTVKGSVSLINHIRKFHFLERSFQGCFCHVPFFVRTKGLFRLCRKLNIVFQTES